MKVLIRHQKREVEVPGRRRVRDVLVELGINPESVLVIRGAQLLTHDAQVGDEDTIELRPVVSGGGDDHPDSKLSGTPVPGELCERWNQGPPDLEEY